MRAKEIMRRSLRAVGAELLIPLAGVPLACGMFASSPLLRHGLARLEPFVATLLWTGLVLVVWQGIRRRDRLAGSTPPVERPAQAEWIAAWGLCSCIVLTLVLLVPVAQAWENPSLHGSLVGGILPRNDAAGYYQGAVELLAGEPLAAWPSRRPINSAWLGVRSGWAGSWEGAILLQVGLLAMGWWLMNHALRAAGLGAALRYASFVLVERFSFESAPTMLSEPLGLALALLAMPLLLPAIQSGLRGRGSILKYALGSGLLALGLSARPGAMFVLVGQAVWPLLLLWPRFATSAIAPKERRPALRLHSESDEVVDVETATAQAELRTTSPPLAIRAKLLATACALVCMVAALGVQPLINGWYGPGYSLGQGSFAHTMYGLVTGQPGWSRVFDDHPELRRLPDDRAQVKRIYELTWEAYRKQPSRLIIGYLRGWQMSGKWIVVSVIEWLKLPSRWLGLLVVASGGLWLLWRARIRRRDDLSLYLVVQVVATIVSMPFFLPDTGIRGLAATWPLCILMLLMGLIPYREHAMTQEAPIDPTEPSPGMSVGRGAVRGRFRAWGELAESLDSRQVVACGLAAVITLSSLGQPGGWRRAAARGQAPPIAGVAVLVYDPERLPPEQRSVLGKLWPVPHWIRSQALVDSWPEPVPEEVIDALLEHPVWRLRVELERAVAGDPESRPRLRWELDPLELVPREMRAGGTGKHPRWQIVETCSEDCFEVRGLSQRLCVRWPASGR
ncbi:MAG: hypothetical protein C0478_05535 [Planctomyces sp.]|nr:hypothetical protein [Planctomyces sp.]